MSQATDRQADPAATTAALAAEAALLEGRLRLLREAIDTVDARIESVSETLWQLRHMVSGRDDGGFGCGDTSEARPSHPRARLR